MTHFFSMELPYIAIALFVLAVTVFIGTRSFISPFILRRFLPALAIFLALAIALHFKTTEDRAVEVEAAFKKGQVILCSERRSKMGDRNIEIVKGELWSQKEGFFINSAGNKFSIRQCIVK